MRTTIVETKNMLLLIQNWMGRRPKKTRLTPSLQIGVLALFALLLPAQKALSQEVIRSNAFIDKCLHKSSPGWNNGTLIHLWDCRVGEDENKVWNYDSTTGYIRSAVNPDKCFHKREGGWNNGNPIHIWDCNAGRPEMKTWTYSASTGFIQSRENPAKCLHKREGDGRNGNPIHIWDCDAGRPDMKTWVLTPYLYVRPNCDEVNALGPALAPTILAELRSRLTGTEKELTRRKTLVLNSIDSVTVSNCRVNVNADVTLERKIRRDASGVIQLSSAINLLSASQVCLRDPRVDRVDLSNTGIIGESFYRTFANLIIPEDLCVSSE